MASASPSRAGAAGPLRRGQRAADKGRHRFVLQRLYRNDASPDAFSQKHRRKSAYRRRPRNRNYYRFLERRLDVLHRELCHTADARGRHKVRLDNPSDGKPRRLGTYALTRSGSAVLGQDIYAGGDRVSSGDSGGTWAINTTGGVVTDAGFRTFVTTPSGTFVSSLKDANPAVG